MNHVKEFLNKPLELMKMIEILKNELKEKQKEIDNINIIYTEVRAGVIKSLAEEKAIRLVELEEQIKAYEEKRDKAIKEVREVIDMLDDDVHKKILELKYIDGMKWEKIAEILNYSRRNIFYARDKALQEVSKILKHCTVLH